jgi:dsDNA-specific endonuclease/ATPase MutS2
MVLHGETNMAFKGEKGKRRRKAASEGSHRSVSEVRMHITDTLDLHTFSPAELEPLLEDYMEECLKLGITEIRIIHGKGKGIQRRRVQSVLLRNPLVQSYHDADPGGGGWGATIAVLGKANIPVPDGQ